ncbi:MAG: hypothetical protein AB1432_16205, partial [Bacteroidota bacterium]
MKEKLSLTTMFKSFFSKFSWPFALVAITVLISIANSPNQWLTGWDTLHPEFNLPLHIYRSIFGVWREDQGLGTLATHAHMSELPRLLVLGLLSLITPLNAVRISFIFLCFVVGSLGIYYFLRDGVFRNKSVIANAASFLGSLIYIFNLGTVQHFYVIFEMFAVQFAALGWLFLFVVKCLYENKKRNWLILFILSFLSAPMAYASQLWFAYFGGLTLFVATLLLIETDKKIFLRKMLKIGAVTLAANVFWLLPNLYFLLSGGSEVPMAAHINRTFSPESFLQNVAYGKIQDVAILKNFLFNWFIYNTNEKKFVDLLSVWRAHLENPAVLFIGYSVFVASLLGIIKGFIKKEKVLIVLLPIFLLTVFMIMNMNPPFDYVFGWFRENISLFKEGLRTPFTKFSLLLMFTIAVYFGVFAEWLMRKSLRIIKSKSLIAVMATIIMGGSLVFYGLPMFQGELISKRMLNEIPHEYFEFYKWAETQPEQTRFAVLPVNSFVGWDFNKWGYQGAGFLWFGMSQPLLVRDFDRWSPYNETFYSELSTAVYGNDKEQFINTLKKYDVAFLVLDESIIDPNQGTIQDILRLKEIKETIASFGIKETWRKDFLGVYDIRSLTGNKPFIYSPKEYSKIESDGTYARRDVAYQNNGNYVSSTDQSVIYPFSSLLKTQIENVTYERNKVTIIGRINENLSNYSLVIPPAASGSTYTASVTASYQANILHIKFGSDSVIKLGNQDIALSQLPDLSINTGSNFASVYVNIGDRQVRVNNGGTEQIEANFEVNQSITIEYFDSAQVVESNGQEYIPFAFMYKTTIDSTVWDKLTKEQRYQVNGNFEEIAITSESLPLTPNLKDSTPNNCDINKRGTMSKNVEDNKIVLESDEHGVVCDGVTLVDLNQRYSYLLRWQAENLKGRGIKFYLHNLTSDKNDIEELLPGNQVDATYSVLSWPNLSGGGYYLSYENRSFGQPSSNVIDKVEVYKLPLDLISKIKLEPNNYSVKIDNQVTLTNSSKFATYEYGADVNVESDSGLIVLSQGYHNGWFAYQGSILNFSFLRHTKYNGWAN